MGLKDIVKEYVLLVRPNDPQSLKEAFLSLREDSVREKYSIKGKSVAKEYNWSKVAGAYSKIYEAIAEA
jgi:glycosyltransferase involved in cell wall biosynthesis